MKKTLTILLAIFFTTFMFSQKVKIKQGSFKNLKEAKEYNLKFDYSNLNIPSFDSEEDFLKEKMKKREEKEPGAGEIFKASWFADREDRYEPKFIESFNKRFDNGEVKVNRNINARYTMLIKTTMMYAGYNVGVWRQNAKIEAIITVFETTTPNVILFSAEYTKIEGNGAMGMDYNSGYRISEAYAKLAKEFAKDLNKKALK
jgi:hypothetical protein